MTNYKSRRQHGNLTSNPVQPYKRGDDDSSSTVDNSDDFEINPANENCSEAVQSALGGDKAIEFTHTSSGVDAVMFSLDEVRMMVLQSIPETVRDTKTSAEWERLFRDAAEIVLPEDASHIGTNATAEDIKDIISFISASLQREAREHHILDNAKPKPSLPKGTSLRYVDAVSLAIAASDDDEVVDPDDDSYCEFVGSKGQEVPRALPVAVVQSPLRDYIRAVSQRQILDALALSDRTSPNKISFTDIEIRYYEQILSDNPSVRSGPPIGIGWRYRTTHKPLAVDTWEERRQNDRRYLAGLMISRHERTSRLLDLGYSRKDLANSIREVMRVKNSRTKTFQNMGFEHFEEILERITKTFMNVLTLGMIKRKERQLLKPYLALKENRQY